MTYKSEPVYTEKDFDKRRKHKALLRYHDEKNWPEIRVLLRELNRTELIGDGPNQLIPAADSKLVKRRKTNASQMKASNRSKSSADSRKQVKPASKR